MFDSYFWHMFEQSGRIDDYLVCCEERQFREEYASEPPVDGRAVNL